MNFRFLPFSLVDVFARAPLSGNGLSVLLLDEELHPGDAAHHTGDALVRDDLPVSGRNILRVPCWIFTMEEELPFAGHPIIGAAAVLHSELHAVAETALIEFAMAGRTIEVTSRREGASYFAEMDQGAATFEAPMVDPAIATFLEALNLSRSDLHPTLPLQVVSTGLPYLIVPITANLEHARIVHPRFEALLATIGAKFVYVLDVDRREGRTWDNDGRVEDIAAGSAVGPAAAYVVEYGLAAAGETIVFAQGRFLGRPSELQARFRHLEARREGRRPSLLRWKRCAAAAWRAVAADARLNSFRPWGRGTEAGVLAGVLRFAVIAGSLIRAGFALGGQEASDS